MVNDLWDVRKNSKQNNKNVKNTPIEAYFLVIIIN